MQNMTLSTSIPPAAKPRRYKSARTIIALVMREMQTTYGRSPGGYIWAVLEPVAALALFSLVFAVGLKLRTPSIGTNFMLFYATGYLPFSLAMSTAKKVSGSLQFSKQLLQYPGVKFTDALIARFLLSVLTHIMVFYFVMTGITVFYGTGTIFNFTAIISSLALAALFGLGVGTMNCFLMSNFPVWDQFWTVLTRPLMILSTVIFSFEEVPWIYQDALWWNPIIHLIGLMRRGIFPTYDAPYVSVIYVSLLSLILLLVGIILLARYYRDLLNL